ncbi:hypothetical protein T4A_4464 [Trichinella pseudospiralis]|uniref:Uncharacterized protein n=1 Tax=Trichinella pseudospiralis TaxID=6337 RepID=A0A0V1DYU3_TRIPS|nr:hypothetical protein T4A_4464 [Trichinella pseudospiralis]KRY87491.1 hypothetical protein T4D_2968 [Trichinella pseudospiralis]
MLSCSRCRVDQMQGFGSAENAAHDENGDEGQNQMTKSEDAVGNLQADERNVRSRMFNGHQPLAGVVRIFHEDIRK